MLVEDFNKYYEDLEQKSPKKKKPSSARKVEHYNRIVMKTQNQLERIRFYAKLNPPDEWEWIYVNGRKTASWIIWQSKSEKWSINLSAYGGLYAVNSAGEPMHNADVCIEEIDSMANELNVRGECSLFDISNSISERRKVLGLSFDSNSCDEPDEDFDSKAKKYHSSK